MNRAAYVGFAMIALAAFVVAYQLTQPQHLYVEANKDTPAQLTTAAGIAALADHLTPTSTPYKSPTPTRTPEPPTETPIPTYGAQTTPGLYEFEPHDPTATPHYEVIDWPLCSDLAASPTPPSFRRVCEVPE